MGRAAQALYGGESPMDRGRSDELFLLCVKEGHDPVMLDRIDQVADMAPGDRHQGGLALLKEIIEQGSS